MFKIYIAALWVVVASLFLPVWPLELIVSFFLYLLLVASLFFVFTLYALPRFKKERFDLALAPLFIMFVFFLSSFVPTVQQPAGPDKEVTVYTQNMLYDVDNSQQVSRQAMEVGADIILLQETYPEHVEAVRQMTGFRDSYFSECNCSANGDELGLVTRYPIVEVKTIEVDVVGGRIMEAVLDIEGQMTRVIGVHLPVPTRLSSYSSRERGFSKLSETVLESNMPTILAGDLNTTIWSPTLRNFSNEVSSSVVNVSTFGGLAKSWCDSAIGIMCLRIDHMFIDNEFAIDEVRTGEYAGSDHRPLIVDIRI